ncbi:MAG: hypothetical protein QOH36_1257 [Actinomycetota bacterium]|nr:hypothetical protein [Actinomycetota bacterium]
MTETPSPGAPRHQWETAGPTYARAPLTATEAATTTPATATANRTATAASNTRRANPDRTRGTGLASIHWKPAGMAGVIIAGAGVAAGRPRR